MLRADSHPVSPAGFQLAGGSIAGVDHLRAGRNRQDAYGWAVRPRGLVAVVADGCGAGPESELGALLACRLLVAGLAGLLDAGLSPEASLEAARRDLLARLRDLAAAAALAPEATRAAHPAPGLAAFVVRHLLFTLVGALLTGEELVTFSLGDGLLVLNGDPTILGPFPDNQPPYLGYALLPAPGELDQVLAFRLHHRVPAAEVRSLVLGSDGASDLLARDPELMARLGSEARFFHNPDLVRRELTLAQRRLGGRALADDTTLVVLRRPGEAP
jgi:hypothetical protein